MERRTLFNSRLLPAVLVAPQLAITFIFFLLPAGGAFYQSTQSTDAFGLNTVFVGLRNFASLVTSPQYHEALVRTAVFCVIVTNLSMAGGLVFASFANRSIHGRFLYRILLIWPYAIAPALTSVIFVFLFQPQIGLITNLLAGFGINFNYATNSNQALALVVLIAAWKQVSYNFIFYLAALQSVPRSIIEAATLDGARSFHRFRTMIWPMLMPTTLFLVVTNLVYSAFDTFDVIYALTGGGPGTATDVLVVKVYRDGVINLDLGGSAAQSVLLMAGIVGLIIMQFRITTRRST
ncbi:ABC transporter permease subunit [Acidocella aminolytica]|uniref:sn-glycerol-3-phosphate transport system permease protein UgpA n=1 Tax=Acidocella aminolytica 101 = DSM 11237 TaxID=1120923 RepID=A0A0D6PIB4_9PROT|nr:ABC transporter permease subunit [Acidocella aminolytica]GAN80569.1 ABC transporter sn-glycerol-3-phosphate permease [Acidocella aminolytica 101 = DSM 11237]GBQ32537.1 sugar ABC transporter permease [Acidocella aminolytica 101 = DSM 11237]SHF57503.1 sn-glycerol 3-phosphate transport system permease protein [Acidocella aminolytica 101 = DSM 11237]